MSNWTVDGPHFGGWEALPRQRDHSADPDRLYASASGGWFGQVIHRLDDGGRTDGTRSATTSRTRARSAIICGTTARPDRGVRSGSGTSNPPGDDPDTVAAGAEDAALYVLKDGGQKWTELTALRQHPTGPHLAAGRKGRAVSAHDHLDYEVHQDRIYRRDLGGRRVSQ